MDPVTIDYSWTYQFFVSGMTVGVVLGTFAFIFGQVLGKPVKWSEHALGG